MPKLAKNLSLRDIKKIQKPGIYAIGHLPGLCVRIGDNLSITYIYRYRIKNMARSITIGPSKVLSLKDALTQATAYKLQLLQGKDPILEKAKAQDLLLQEIKEKQKHKVVDTRYNFEIIADKFVEYRKACGAYKHNKKGEQSYPAMLVNHVYPILKNRNIKTITPKDIRDVLSFNRMWQEKPATSQKLVIFLKQIFDWAKAEHYFEGENPASMNGPLKTLMEAYKNDRVEPSHYPSLDYKEIPEFMLTVWNESKGGTIGADALFFSILTATRSKAVRYLTWNQLNLRKQIWNLPLASDKNKKEKRNREILLSDYVIRFLKTVIKRHELVFPSKELLVMTDSVFGSIISEINTKRKAIGKMPFVDHNILDSKGNPRKITQHGTARSTFKTWSKSYNNVRNFLPEAVELCLLHERKDPNHGAYDRSPMTEERLKVLQEWGKYCCSLIPELQPQELSFSTSSN